MSNQVKTDDYKFAVGDTVVVHQKVLEKSTEGKEPKTRIQLFEGVVISIKGRGENKNFTVRKLAAGNIGVERIWSLNSPWVAKIKTKKQGSVRRAKLYYLRQKTGKRALRVKSK